jgi:HEAT repeat protein
VKGFDKADVTEQKLSNQGSGRPEGLSRETGAFISDRELAVIGHIGQMLSRSDVEDPKGVDRIQEARETALAALNAPHARTRRVALLACERLGCLSTQALVGALEDPDPLVRERAAILAIGRNEISLGKVLRDGDALVVCAGVYAVGERRWATREEEEALLAAAREHPDARVREAAVASLGCLGKPEHLEVVIRALREDSIPVRRRAVVALAAFEGPLVEQAFKEALLDRDWQVRALAEDLGG